MDAGSPRGPQPADRRVVSRQPEPQAAYRQAEAPQEYARQPRTARQPEPKEPRSKKGLAWTLGIIGAILVLAVAGWALFSALKPQPTGIDNSKYQAVFLSNGQIYFGKLTSFSDKTFKITSVYYPQAQATDEGETSAQTSNNIQIIRLGEEVHGPENEMIIYKDQVLYYENLKADSRVSQLIDQNEK